MKLAYVWSTDGCVADVIFLYKRIEAQRHNVFGSLSSKTCCGYMYVVSQAWYHDMRKRI